jgi:hypothetical protein
MQPAEWFTITRNVLGPSKFFLQSPYRNGYFLTVSLLLFMDIGVCGLILAKFWKRFGFFGFSWLGLGMFLLIGLWFLALRAHERLSFLFTNGQIEELEIGSPLDVALGIAAHVSNVGLFLAFGAAAALLMTLGWVLVGY